MSKLIELLKQLNIEPTPTKILLFKQWVIELIGNEKEQTGFVGHNCDDIPEYSHEGYEIRGYNVAKAEIRKKIEEG